MRFRLWVVTALAVSGLAGCGTSPLEQGVFGAGAGTGAAVLTGVDPVTGAVLGAAGTIAYCQIYDGNCR